MNQLTERQAAILEARARGERPVDTAARLGFPRSGYTSQLRAAERARDGKRKQRGVRSPHAERDAVILQLCESGMSYDAIAREIHGRGLTDTVLSRQRIGAIIKRV